ncbi:MAG: aryl-sulfate sulfotransferase [Lachnospiraceae bacterium]
MKRILSFTLAAAMALSMAGCGKTEEAGQAPVTDLTAMTTGTLIEETDTLAAQAEVDKQLIAELSNGYTIDNPLVVLDPYSASPLTAVAIFKTEEETSVTVTVKGKAKEDNVSGVIEASTDHVVPIYGLYADYNNKVVLKLEDGTSKTVEIQTEAIDAIDTSGFEVNMYDESAFDYGCLTICSGAAPAGSYALDSKGELRWFMNTVIGSMPIKRLSNGHMLAPTAEVLHPQYYKEGVVEFDWTGKVYNKYILPGGEHHEIAELPNGNLLVSSDESDFSYVEDVIRELDRNTGEVVWELDMKDILNQEDGMCIAKARTDEDWFHNNSFWYDAASDMLLISGRHVDAIIGVKKETKELQWILGDPAGWDNTDSKYFFTPVEGDEDFEWHYLPHNITMTSNGDIMLFDNGGRRQKAVNEDKGLHGDDVYSRAVQYRINTEDMTIEQVWEYGKERGKDWYSEWISGAFELDSPDNIWVTAGSHLLNEETGETDYGPYDMFGADLKKMTHIDQVKDGKLVYELVPTGLIYRSIRLPLYSEGNLDISIEPSVLGNGGQTATVTDITPDFENAQTDDSYTFTKTSYALKLNGSYEIESADALQDFYLVLHNENSTLVYKMNQTTAEADGKVTATVADRVTPVGLEGNGYDLYVVKDGVTYNTGSSVIFE